MCTLSIVSSSDHATVRLLFNRDERRMRPVASPPALQDVGHGHAIWPIDPVGGGTWVAANADGLAFALLNAGMPRPGPDAPSRGRVIPVLAGARSFEEVFTRWRGLDTTRFQPFRLVVVSRHEVAVLTRGRPDPIIVPAGRAHVFSSSSLGDALVEEPRRELLTRLLRTTPDPWVAQTRYHHHAWPDRRHLSVMMSRPDACTVSCTDVRLTPDGVTMHYMPVVDGWPVSTVTRQLALDVASGHGAPAPPLAHLAGCR